MNSWKRYELKDRAKQVLKINYWLAFLVTLIFVIIDGGIGFSNSGWRTDFHFGNRTENRYESFREFREEFPEDLKEGILFDDDFDKAQFAYFIRKFAPFAIGLIALVSGVALVISIALRILVINPLKMGCRTFFKTAAENPHKNIGPLGTGFRSGNYGPVIKAMFLRDLYTFLWSLLFIIPGIIKSYAYRMVPYILADDPKIDASEAIALSRKMMMGEKWNTFVLDLSFIGWYILGTLALGIGVLFVHPYYFSTDAQLYLALRSKPIYDDPRINGGQNSSEF